MPFYKKKQNKLSQTRWYRQGGEGAFFYFGQAFWSCAKTLGYDNVYAVHKGPMHYGYFNRDVEARIARRLLARQVRDPKTIDALIERWQRIDDQMRADERYLENPNLSTEKKSGFEAAFKRFIQFNFKLWEIGIMIEMFDPFGEQFIRERLKRERILMPDEDIAALLKPAELLVAGAEELALAKISLIKDTVKRRLAVKSHWRKFFWLNNDWARARLLPLSYFTNKLSRFVRLGRFETKKFILASTRQKRYLAARQKALLKKYHCSRELGNLFYFFRRLTYWRDWRKAASLRHIHLYHLLTKKFAKISGWDYRLFNFAVPTEPLGYRFNFSNKYKKYLESRTKLVVYCFSRGRVRAITGQRAKLIASSLEKSLAGHHAELKGATGNRGVARGTVKIVNVVADFSKMRVGDILVAPMTRPEYLPVMKIAGAIVTDEGGITSHAAIVSRELGKPCLIGTQVATEVLKDGQLVEVDATRGIIQIP